MQPEWLNNLQIDLHLAQELSFNPYYGELQAGLGKTTQVAGTPILDLASNNYLGLANDQRVVDAAGAALAENGLSLCGTPIAIGANRLYNMLCRKLEAFLGLERAVLYPSCYQANMGLFASLAGKQDVILVDQFAHASLLQGMRITRARIMPFAHNDMDYLKKLLGRCEKYRRVLVVSESVFSTRGTICPLARMHALAEEFGALSVIDDSHGLGVLGAQGRGILEHEDIQSYSGIYTASLGKALGGQGGVVAAPAEIMEYLRYANEALIYSTALTPPVIGGLLEVLRIIAAEFPARSAKLAANRMLLLETAGRAGLKTIAGDAPIIGVMQGSER
ncbi:MAG: aminotransferase class I/II-fold pyridoxal phosphate-dependent enzyme, partial [Desulfobulbales bacterium]